MSFRSNPFKRSNQQRAFKYPVGWLLGQQLLAGLKWIAIYALYGDKLDFRDWMQGQIIEDVGRGWPGNEAFWFDYIADTGDGQRATYSIAYLCQGDLYLPEEDCKPGPERVSLQNGSYLLPRGQFLFIGGDTAYHIADLPTLAERFQTPFNWAYEDRFGPEPKDENVRPIFAIPANHDYYDFLDGFNRQFRIPLQGTNTSPLYLKGYRRMQTTSYVALHLPFDWWLLGIDSQNGKVDRIDKRQQAFFRAILNPYGNTPKPDKLIVATPEPSTVFGQWATRTGEKGKLVRIFDDQLGLTPCFLEEGQGNLPASQCRLDISGDIHHYARYWGLGSDDPGPSRPNYASVVAGGGGAFLHPSHTDVKQVAHNALYPARGDSHRVMLKRLLNPWNIKSGGYVWLAGAITALLAYFAVAIPQSTWSVLRLIDDALRPCRGAPCGDALLERIQAALSAGQSSPFSFFSQFTFELLYAVALAVFLWKWMSRLDGLGRKVAANPDEWRREVWRFLAPCLVAGLPILFFIAALSQALPPAFLASSIILAFAVSSVISLMIGRRYADLVIERAKHHHPSTFPDKLATGFFILFAVLGFCYGLWRYGSYPVAVMFSDVITLLILLLVGGGLVWLAGSYGAKLQFSTPGKLRFWGIGLWHAMVQIVVPVCLSLFGSWQEIGVITAVVLVATEAVKRYGYDRDNEDKNLADPSIVRLLSIIWLVLGLLTLSITWWGTAVPVDWGRLILAFALGALYSCVWFGWYLAITMSLNGHNNEAGGGARSEQYRHLIRFKLTRDTLTGYVIGIDNPKDHIDDKGHFKPDSRVRLVDVFTVKKSG